MDKFNELLSRWLILGRESYSGDGIMHSLEPAAKIPAFHRYHPHNLG